ncbi:GlcG/HbpS family heme-binding protein [Pseudomonas sp. CCOS 191]|uniref:GlcG/HbpS family heme-binding protein n=1 Tax=Pseudomonas sp. CCOS 191 TaxID=1649877 RepID=UPI0006246374|nr:heme-binding protein [Pseudomonas sp. CCOS 191]CRI55278.1 putative secreted protein [Pseudomonas sp. CCOS 191]
MKRKISVITLFILFVNSTACTTPLSRTAPSIGIDPALTAALAAKQACEQMGFAVAVTVVGRHTEPVVLIVSDNAFAHAVETSQRKAVTAASRRVDTSLVAAAAKEDSELGPAFHAVGLTTLSGGLPLQQENAIIGGIGVAGAPGQTPGGRDHDSQCAEAGLKAIGLVQTD